MHARKVTGVTMAVKVLSTRVLRRILKAQETLFKYGTLIPRSDREAEQSPKAIRWRSGRQLEWLSLLAAKTFETDWTWERIRKEFLRSDADCTIFVHPPKGQSDFPG